MNIPDLLFLVFTNFAILLVCLSGLWAVSVRIKDASIIDIAWGPACALPAVLTLLRTDGTEPRASLLTILVVLWALRLAWHLGRRNLGHGEDFRYVKMRAKQGSDKAFARWSLIYIYGLQGLIAWFVSLPVQVGQFDGAPSLGLLGFLGVAVFAFGLAFETIGDWQLKRFKANPDNKGKLMTTGLWAWTRHPNYFGDAAVWTGLTMIALESQFGWATILSPILMTYFLYNISGKALLERSMKKKYPEYEEYKSRVSGFIPWPFGSK